MKRLLTALLCAANLTAFASTVTATVVDTDGQTWNNGTFTANLIFPDSQFRRQSPTVGGVAVNPTIQGSLSSSGVLTAVLTDTSTVDQPGAQWAITVCPNTSGNLCITVTTKVIGTTPNLSPQFSGLTAPRFAAAGQAYGYLDKEVQLPPPAGALYYNVTLQCLRQWNGLAWTGSCSGGSSGFPFTLGSTTIASGSTTTAVNNFSVNGVSLNAGGSSSLFLNQAGGYTAPPGTGNTTSTSLTTNAIPKANGPNSLINSCLSDNGTTLTYACGSVNSIQLATNVFSALPACNSGAEGTWAPVTDSTTNVWGAVITGSGTNHVLAYCNGTAWSVMGAKNP